MDKLEKYVRGLKDQNSKSRRLSAYKLGFMRDTKAFDELVEAMDDRDPFVRSNVAEALGNIGNVNALKILNKYLDEKDISVKSSVIESIGKIVELSGIIDNDCIREIATKLLTHLGSSKYIIRHYSSEALSKIGGDYVERGIRDLIINGNDIEKEFSIWTIGKMNSLNYKEQMADIFEETENINIKRSVLSTFERLGLDVKKILEERGLNYKEIKEELFKEEDFDDRLFYNL